MSARASATRRASAGSEPTAKARSSTWDMRCWPIVWATRSRSALPRSLISAELVANTTVTAGATLDGGASRVSFGAGRDDLGSASGVVVSAGFVEGSCTTDPIVRTFWAKAVGAPRPKATPAPRPKAASARLQASRDLVINDCLSRGFGGETISNGGWSLNPALGYRGRSRVNSHAYRQIPSVHAGTMARRGPGRQRRGPGRHRRRGAMSLVLLDVLQKK